MLFPLSVFARVVVFSAGAGCGLHLGGSNPGGEGVVARPRVDPLGSSI